MHSHQALAAMYGHRDREQTVFTPQYIIDAVVELYGLIQYDPCHGHPSVVLTKPGREAKRDNELPEDVYEQVDSGLANPVQSVVNAVTRTDTEGLTAPWPHRTFCNPPYDKLKSWLEMSGRQPESHVVLVPVRCHRKWWRKWAKQAEIVELNPVTFQGHDGSFPGPMCLASRNHWEPGALTAICEKHGIGEGR